jgi:hypothetical protein
MSVEIVLARLIPDLLFPTARSGGHPMRTVQSNSLGSTRVARPNKLVSQQMLDEIGIRHRIAYPLSPKKTVATLRVLAELMSPPDRV